MSHTNSIYSIFIIGGTSPLGKESFAAGASDSSKVKSFEPPSQGGTSSDSSKDSSGMEAFEPTEYTDGSTIG